MPDDGVRLRRALPSDAPRLTAIARAAKAGWGYPAPWLDAWRAELAISEAYVESCLVVVAERAGTGAASPDAVVAVARRGAHWSLEHLWVAPDAQGRGIGRRLLQAALAHVAREAPGACVTIVSDPHAAAFYEHMGARRVGEAAAPMPGAPARTLPVLELRARGDTEQDPMAHFVPASHVADAASRSLLEVHRTRIART